MPIHEQIIEQDQEKRNNDIQQEIEPSNEDSVNNGNQEESKEFEFNYDFEEEVQRFAKKYAEIKDEASLEEKEMFITSHFDDYVADGYVKNYFYTIDDFIEFEYSNGVLGGVMLKDFDPMLN